MKTQNPDPLVNINQKLPLSLRQQIKALAAQSSPPVTMQEWIAAALAQAVKNSSK